MRRLFVPLLLLLSTSSLADIPATPVMTLYQFNGKLDVPYYEINAFLKSGTAKPAGSLAQGSAVIPCLAIKNGKPVTDRKGTPYVGFTVVMDARKATPKSARQFSETVNERRSLRVRNHHCDSGVRHVISVRKMYAKKRPPRFEPPRSSSKSAAAGKRGGELDSIIRAFHNSPQCAEVNKRLMRRRGALEQAWNTFISRNGKHWPARSLKQARHLDYTLRTTLFEGHLDRGCNAYGACERNTIALSIRNRGLEPCSKRQGCGFPGDFKGVSSKVSQYNIWDEYLTQISGLTACYLRDDLPDTRDPEQSTYYTKLQRMYAQSQPDIERILFGNDQDLKAIFPGNSLTDLKQLRHYYHAPAMGKCFPNHPRVEYISGAVAHKGSDFALIANSRIRVDQSTKGGYFFRMFDVTPKGDRDETKTVDRYPGFVIDGRKVALKRASRCVENGISAGCRTKKTGRYRRTPPWLKAGQPLALKCRIQDRGAQCKDAPKSRSVEVGGVCDIEMRPVARVK